MSKFTCNGIVGHCGSADVKRERNARELCLPPSAEGSMRLE